MRRDRHPIHGRRWTWRHPLSWTCRRRLAAWPRPVQGMLLRARLSQLNVRLEKVGTDGTRNVVRHYRWSGGAR